MNYRLAYMIINSILLGLFLLTSIIYYASSAYPFLVAILFFSFNPTLLLLGVAIIILGNFYPVSIINKFVPFLGIVGINIPSVVGRSMFPDLEPSVAMVYVGTAFGSTLFLFTALVFYFGLKASNKDQSRG